jgi:hypothetical protein
MPALYGYSGNANVSVGNTTGLYIGSGNVLIFNSAQTLYNLLANSSSVGFELVNSNQQVTAVTLPTGVSPGTYGDSLDIPIITVGSDGRITNISNVAVSIPANTYGNANVAAYLASGTDPTINSLLANAAVQETEISGLRSNIIAANTQIQTLSANLGAFETYANATFTVSSYGNSNVAAYLPTDPNIRAIWSNINLTNANIGAFETYANAAFATQANVGTIYTHLNTLDANVGAFETYANLTFGPGSHGFYSNANVSAYLPTYLPTYNGTLGVQNINGPTDTSINITSNLTDINLISGHNINFDLSAGFGLGGGNVNINPVKYVMVNGRLETIGSNDILSGGNLITTNGVFWANGVEYVSTISSSYSNVNVAAYIPTDPNIQAIWSNITLTNANVTAANAQIQTLSANVGLYESTTNANIGSISNHLNTLDANVGLYESTTNANIGSISNHLNTLDANVGLYESTTNANIGTLYLGNISINANLGAFQTYANIFFGNLTTTVYGNSNVATFLASGFGSNTITTTGNITAGNVTIRNLLQYNNDAPGYTNYTTSGGTTTLTATATYYQHFSGTNTQTLKMPDETTIPTGTAFVVDNDSTQNITLQDSAGGALGVVTSGMAGYIYSLSNTAATGNWAGYAYVPGTGPTGQVTWGTAGLNMGGGNLTTTGNITAGNIIAANLTGSALYFSGNLAGNVLYDGTNFLTNVQAASPAGIRPIQSNIWSQFQTAGVGGVGTVGITTISPAPARYTTFGNAVTAVTTAGITGLLAQSNVTVASQPGSTVVNQGSALQTQFLPLSNTINTDRFRGSVFATEFLTSGQTWNQTQFVNPAIFTRTQTTDQQGGVNGVAGVVVQSTMSGFGNSFTQAGMSVLNYANPSTGPINVNYLSSLSVVVGYPAFATNSSAGTSTINFARGLLIAGARANNNVGTNQTINNLFGIHFINHWENGGSTPPSAFPTQLKRAIQQEDGLTEIYTAGNVIIAGNLIQTAAANTVTFTGPTVHNNNVTISGSSSLLQITTFTVAALTAITGTTGQIAAVSNGTGKNGGQLAYWDTTNSRWSWFDTNLAVS